MNLPVSVITIVKSRTEKLCRLINQLESCSPLPSELVIVWMCSPSDLSLVKSSKFNIVHKFVTHATLPIAKARNRGLQDAQNNLLVYMDVDAIVNTRFLAEGLNAWQPNSVVFTKVHYIPSSQWSLAFNTLQQLYPQHRQTNEVTRNKQENSHGKFSNSDICSTVFFISKTDFKKTGGFDEGYDGFGLNDEDFFTNCQSLGFKLHQIDLATFAPERPNYKCPINHLLDFVSNSERYHAKWGKNPRLDVLHAYAEAGYINHDFETAGIHVLRLPSPIKKEKATQSASSIPAHSVMKQTA